MFRSVIFVLSMLACAGAVSAQEPLSERPQERSAVAASDDRFVVSDDLCGASRYQHLLGREYAQTYHASLLPADSNVQHGAFRRTLEYTPQQLNVVVGEAGRIVAIGCF